MGRGEGNGCPASTLRQENPWFSNSPLPPLLLPHCIAFINDFIEVQLPYHGIHPSQLYTLMILATLLSGAITIINQFEKTPPPHIQTHTLYKILCVRLQIIIIPTPSSRQPLIYFLFYLLGTFHINKSIQSVGSASVFPTFHNVFKYLRLIQDVVCDQSSFLFF